MAGTKVSRARRSPGGNAGKKSLSSMEHEAAARAGLTISAIDDFLSAYDRARLKPSGILPQVMRLKGFRDALRGWREGEGGAEARLRELALICESYSQG
jgi:hypothetical protein